MPVIIVAPLSAIGEALSRHRPSHMVSLLSPQHMIATPDDFDPARHLRLGINDIVDPGAGSDPPARIHADQLIAFGRSWNAQAPLLIHCWAGISRSMASAFTLLCDRAAPGSETEIALWLRGRARHALPNALLVRHADEAMGRKGRMLAALDAMGEAEARTEGMLTEFPLAELPVTARMQP